MRKIINPYKDETYGGRSYNVFMKIEYENGKLSVTGVEGPLPSGNCLGDYGQIIMNFKEYDPHGYMSRLDVKLNAGWNRSMFKKFLDVWDKWHLNDVQSACEHQRELGWTYENHRGMYIEVPRKKIVIDEYDDGTSNDPIQKFDEFKGHLCPVCGYSIGSAWLKMEVPQDVIDFLFSLPDTEIIPAWV